jgi:cytochrome c oxidase assembly protein subunit 15
MSQGLQEPRGAPVELSQADADSARRIAIGFASLAGITYILIVLGALVRANGAGLACPDWPLCFGQVIPTFDLRVAFEWGHRALAGSVALIFVTLSILTLRKRALRRLALPLLGLAAILLAVQILLGALTVWKLLVAWSVTSHLMTGNAFAIALVFIWQRLHEAARPARTHSQIPGPLRLVVALSAGVLIVQLILGGLVASSYAGLACPDWPTCRDGVWFPSFAGALGLQLSHRIGAYGLLVLLTGCALATRGRETLGRLMAVAAMLGLAQGVVGILNVLWRLPVEVSGLHSALAAALACLMALSVREAFRRPA